MVSASSFGWSADFRKDLTILLSFLMKHLLLFENASMTTTKTLYNKIYYVATSMSGKDEPNPVL